MGGWRGRRGGVRGGDDGGVTGDMECDIYKYTYISVLCVYDYDGISTLYLLAHFLFSFFSSVQKVLLHNDFFFF